MKRKLIIVAACLFVIPLVTQSCGLLSRDKTKDPADASNQPNFTPSPSGPGAGGGSGAKEGEKVIEQYPKLYRFPLGEERSQPVNIAESSDDPLAPENVAYEPTPEEVREKQLLELLKAVTAKAGGARLIEATALIAEGKPDEAYELLKSGDSGDDLLLKFLLAYLDYKLGNNTDSLKEVEALLQKMRSEMPMQIATVELCRKVESYAKYEAFAQRVFKPGETALIYCEPLYFCCVKTEKGYLTSLNVRYIVTDSSEKVVWKREYPIDHVTSSYLYDLFLMHYLTVPDVPDGNYTLRVELQDKQNEYDKNHVAVKTLVFEVRRR
jgi:hypothetical protein